MSKPLKSYFFLLELIKRSNRIFRSTNIINNRQQIALKQKTDARQDRVKKLHAQVKNIREKLKTTKNYYNSKEFKNYIENLEIERTNKLDSIKKNIIQLQKELTKIQKDIKKNEGNKKLKQKKINELKNKIGDYENKNLKIKQQIKEENKKKKDKESKFKKIKELEIKKNKDNQSDFIDNELIESLEKLQDESSSMTKSKLNLDDLTESKDIYQMLVNKSTGETSKGIINENVFNTYISRNLIKFGKLANANIVKTNSKILEMRIENSELENQIEFQTNEITSLQNKIDQSKSDNIGGANFYVSFSDIISVLLCFFILFFAMGTVDGDKAKKLASTFTEKTMNKKQVFNAYLSEDDVKMLGKVKELMLDNVKPEDIVGSKTKTTSYIISGSDLFYPGETELSEDGIDIIKKKVLKEDIGLVKELIIEGHTDDKEFSEFPAIQKKYNDNIEFSAARAIKVVEIIENELKFSRQHIGIRAYGANRPLKPNTTDINRAQNRRIEIKITTELKNELTINNPQQQKDKNSF
ncbi:MAG: OmpA family protein [Nitrospinae bacterium]|nr:OmpA family protein [Nitrospinota bacterium]MZH15328.1 OmpA family protein [Nitrospinota bacterium]